MRTKGTEIRENLEPIDTLHELLGELIDIHDALQALPWQSEYWMQGGVVRLGQTVDYLRHAHEVQVRRATVK